MPKIPQGDGGCEKGAEDQGGEAEEDGDRALEKLCSGSLWPRGVAGARIWVNRGKAMGGSQA